MEKTKIVLKKIFFLFFIFPCFLFAAESSADNNPTLDLLVKKGIISPEERSQLMQDITTTKPLKPIPTPFFTVDPVVKHLSFNGRLQMQYFNGNYTQQGANPGVANPTNSIYFRRLYLGVKVDMAEHFSAIVVANLAEPVWIANRSFDKAYVTYDNPFIGAFDAGFKKVQWGFEENTSSGKLLTIERSATNRFWAEMSDVPGSPYTNLGLGARHVGIFYTYNWKLNSKNNVEYIASLVNPQLGWTNRNINVFGFYTSLTYTLKYSDKNHHVFGLNYANTPAYVSSLNPASTTPAVCGAIMGAISGFNPYIKSQFDSFILEAEYMTTRIAASNSQFPGCNNYKDHSPNGYTFLAAYKFIPELELVLRYSVLDTDGVGTVMSQGVREGVTMPLPTTRYNGVKGYYGGLNYYIVDHNIKLQLGYEHFDYSGYIASYVAGVPQIGQGTASADTIRAQLQLNF